MAIFCLVEKKLIGNDFEDSIFILRNSTFDIKEEELLKNVYNNKLTLEKWEEKFKEEIQASKKNSSEIF